MHFFTVTETEFNELIPLHAAYKREIGEEPPKEEELSHLLIAIKESAITFYGCREGERLIGCCSVSLTFSTFNYRTSGVFEDFYILPEYRKKGIARKLVRFAFKESGVGSLTVGCADCDRAMYSSLGFSVPLGNLMAYDE